MESGIAASAVVIAFMSFPQRYSKTPLFIKGNPVPPWTSDTAIKTPILWKVFACITKSKCSTTHISLLHFPKVKEYNLKTLFYPLKVWLATWSEEYAN
jgi:hypothetical protein